MIIDAKTSRPSVYLRLTIGDKNKCIFPSLTISVVTPQSEIVIYTSFGAIFNNFQLNNFTSGNEVGFTTCSVYKRTYFVGSNILLIITHGVGRGILTGVCKIETAGLGGGTPGTDKPRKETNDRRSL